MSRLEVALLAGLLVATTPAVAEAADPSDRAAAERLFRSAREAAKRGDFGAACTGFAQSQRLDPAVGTLLNLAECEEKLGRLVSASRYLSEALERLKPKDERYVPARARQASLMKRIPHLTLRLGNDAPKGTTVARDGAELSVASLGAPEQVDPGEHRVVVQAPDHADASIRITLAEGEDRTIDLTPGTPQTASRAPTASVPAAATPAANTMSTKLEDPGKSQRTLGLIVGGVGVVGIGVGAAFGILAMAHKSDRDASCRGTFPQCSAGTETNVIASREAFNTTGTISTIGFVAGGVGLAAGAVLYFTARSRSDSVMRFAPLVARDGAAVVFGRAW